MATTFTNGFLSRDEAGEDILLPAALGVATIELTTVASRNYAVGEYMIYGNNLCKVTAPIYRNGSIAASVVQTTIADELKNGGAIVLSATLAAGETSLSFTNNSINNNSRIQPWSNQFGVGPTDAVVSGSTLTLTFDAQQTALSVQVAIWN